jgi:5-methyltetrahydropteroyltriglutamate--homocysteine methyltransferase
MDVITDGEYRRDSWLTGIQDAVEGFVQQNRMAEWKGPGGGLKQVSGRVVAAKLRQKGRLYAHEAAFLAAHAAGPWKITTPSATQFAGTSYMEGVTTPYYPTREDLLDELTRIVGDEIRALVGDGVVTCRSTPRATLVMLTRRSASDGFRRAKTWMPR